MDRQHQAAEEDRLEHRKIRERPRASAYAAIVATTVDSATAPAVTSSELRKYSPKCPSVHARR